jgi:NOL1/NOP2/sun family putative RNA methylase
VARQGISRRAESVSLDRYRSFIPDWRGFQEAAVRPEPTVFRVRTTRMEPERVVERLHDQGFRVRALEGMPAFFQVEEEPFPVTFTLEHWAGLIYVQQASTGVAAPALDPRPGERVLDLCSAPGGKTSHAADLMDDTGCVVAADISEGRIRGLLGNAYRLGHTNIMVVAGDGREFPEEAKFDRVLVDAPCTGEGTLRRRGGEPPSQSRSFLGYVTGAQEALLRKAIRVTRPGGVVLYVTCTFAPEENEAVVDAVLRDEPVSLEPLELPVPHAPGLTSFEGRSFHPDLEGAARVYPHHLDSGGLFLARLRVEGEGGVSGSRALHGDSEGVAGVPSVGGGRAGGVGWTPVPSVFPGEDESADEARELAATAEDVLTRYYGLDASALDGMGWILRGGRLWLHSLDAWPLEAWSPGSWRPVTVGFRGMEFDRRGRPRPTNDVLQWLGHRIRSSLVELDDDELDRVLAREKLPHRDGLKGLVAFRWRDVVLGRGACTDEGIRSEIPKARARELARGREKMEEAGEGEASTEQAPEERSGEA